jgi:hypothetical protein
MVQSPAADAVAVGVQVVGADARRAGVGIGEQVGGGIRQAQAGVAAPVHGQPDVLGERGPQPVLVRHRAHRRDEGTPAALEIGRDGVGADQRDAADAVRGQRQQVGLVAEQHRAASGDLAQQAELLRRGLGRYGGRRRLIQCADMPGQAQQPQHLVVDQLLVHLARAHGGSEGVTPRTVWTRHHQIQTTDRRGHGGPGRGPVAHHGPGETPLALQHPAQQPRVLGHRR